MATQSERNEKTRRALIDAGRGLFAERGYTDVSVTELAKRAGVSTGALYHQFGSKEELFKVVYAELVRGVGSQVVKARQSNHKPTLLGDCEAYMNACADPTFNRITIDGPAVIGWDRILDEAQALIEASLSAARDRGEIADAQSGPLARMLGAALKEAAMIIATAEDPAAARVTANESARQLITGLLRA
jgi:AcrR family transcriptional regulator